MNPEPVSSMMRPISLFLRLASFLMAIPLEMINEWKIVILESYVVITFVLMSLLAADTEYHTAFDSGTPDSGAASSGNDFFSFNGSYAAS